MKINLQSPVEEVQVQIIPLIDVIFCILSFFLLAALQFTRQQAISVDLPKASTGTATTTQVRQTLIVSVDAVGQVFVEQEPVTSEQLYERLQSYRQQNPSGLMVLNASRTSTYNDVVQVLDVLREVGGDRVALATLPGTAEQPTGASTPITPGLAPLPGSTPIAPPIPTTPGQGLNPINPNTTPVFPTAPSPQATVNPGQLEASPQR